MDADWAGCPNTTLHIGLLHLDDNLISWSAHSVKRLYLDPVLRLNIELWLLSLLNPAGSTPPGTITTYQQCDHCIL
jgi:hypothetical protein